MTIESSNDTVNMVFRERSINPDIAFREDVILRSASASESD
jgi:hypothetical protein